TQGGMQGSHEIVGRDALGVVQGHLRLWQARRRAHHLEVGVRIGDAQGFNAPFKTEPGVRRAKNGQQGKHEQDTTARRQRLIQHDEYHEFFSKDLRRQVYISYDMALSFAFPALALVSFAGYLAFAILVRVGSWPAPVRAYCRVHFYFTALYCA